MEDSSGKTFYDIHMHVFTLDHPNLAAFLRRSKNAMKLPQWYDIASWVGLSVALLAALALSAPLLVQSARLRDNLDIAVFGLVSLALLVSVFSLLSLRAAIASRWIAVGPLALIVISLGLGAVVPWSPWSWAGLPALLVAAVAASLWARGFIHKKGREASAMLDRVQNLLAVMERDPGDYFSLMERDLKGEFGNGQPKLLDSGRLRIGSKEYSRIVLTPLIMDFDYRQLSPRGAHYVQTTSFGRPRGRMHKKYDEPRKPVDEQIADLFRGILEYRRSNAGSLIEIYPFLGIDPGRDEYKDSKAVEERLGRVFKDYKGSRKALQEAWGKLFEDYQQHNFDLDTVPSGSNYFAGIKLYPPLGFDPWPDDGAKKDKVKALYKYCQDRQIPVTVHSSQGGFVVVGENEMEANASIVKWEHVLGEYTHLKLNLAHFPINSPEEASRLRVVINLIMNNDHPNVYADFAIRAIDEAYYIELKKLLDNKPGLRDRILFGSDFPMVLLDLESYNQYVKTFSDTSFGEKGNSPRNAAVESPDQLKDKFCSTNPEKFLFSSP